MEAVRAVFSYLSRKKQQTTIHTLLKMSRLPTKAPKTFENFDFSLLKGKDVERLRVLPSLNAIYSTATWPSLDRPVQGKPTWPRPLAMPAASTG